MRISLLKKLVSCILCGSLTLSIAQQPTLSNAQKSSAKITPNATVQLNRANRPPKLTKNPLPAKVTKIKCPDSTRSDLEFTKSYLVPWNYSDLWKCLVTTAVGTEACYAPTGFTAWAVASDGTVKPTCPLSIDNNFGQFGVDVSDDFKPTVFIVARKDDTVPHRLSAETSTSVPQRKHYTQIVTANFSTIATNLRGMEKPCPEKIQNDDDKLCTGYIQNADGTIAEKLLVHDLSDYSATIQYDATADFKPASFTVSYTDKDNELRSQAFPFAIVQPQEESTVNFAGNDLSKFLSGGPCDPYGKLLVVPSPNQSAVVIDPVEITEGILVARVSAPTGYLPNFVVVSAIDDVAGHPCSGLIARRITTPPVNEKSPNISFTMLDQETVRRSFGTRIEANYLVAMVEAHNPTVKKLQLNKSALWFDVDYIEVYNKKKENIVRRSAGFGSDLHTNDVFIPQDAHVFRYGIDHTQRHYPHNFGQILASFDATTTSKNNKALAFELMGSILVSIATAESNNNNLNIATHLITGILIPGVKSIALSPDNENRMRSNLVNQGLQNIVQIPPLGSVSTLVFLPRKSILAVVDRIEKPVGSTGPNEKKLFVGCGDQRARKNDHAGMASLGTTASATVSGVSTGTASAAASGEDTGTASATATPGEAGPASVTASAGNIGISSPGMDRPLTCDKKPYGGAKSETQIVDPEAFHHLVPVVIKKVLEVRWDPEVISEVNAETVIKGILKVGMSKDQVRQALGEPQTVTTAGDKTSCFLYDEGKYSKVCFDAAGLSNSLPTQRPIAEQVSVAKTYEKIRTILLGDGPLLPLEKRDLVDGSFVWFNAPQVQANLRFDSKGDLIDPNYKEGFDQLNPLKGKTKKEFEQTAERLALNDDTKKAIQKAEKSTQNPISYPSPDIKGENVDVKFKSAAKAGPKASPADDWVIEAIERTLRK